MDMRNAIMVAAIRGDALLLVRKNETWIPPGGKPEGDESNEECLIRELSEELPGCTVSNLQPLGVWHGLTPHTGDFIRCFVYLGDVRGDISPSAEIADARWVPTHELDSLNLSDATRQLVETLRFTGRL